MGYNRPRSRLPGPAARLAALIGAAAACFVLPGSPGSVQAQSPPIVFASRSLGAFPGDQARTTAVERAASGRLVLLDNGDLRVLVDGTALPDAPVDVTDPDVNYDATRIVFAGFSKAQNAWRIYEVGVDGTGLRQITRSDRVVDLERHGPARALLEGYDDVDPCYLPDGRICFVSTRYPEVAPDNRLRSTNLYVMNADGSDLHRITSERFGADTPTVDPSTGQVVYSRWWRTAQLAEAGSKPEPIPPGSPGYGDQPPSGGGTISPNVLTGINEGSFPGVNSWFLSSVNPDGTGLAMFSGVRIDRQATQAYRPSFLPTGEALALFIPRTPFLGFPGPNGLRKYTRGASGPVALAGPQTFGGGFPGRGVDAAGQAFPPDAAFPMLFGSVAALQDGRILVSASLDGQNFDLFVHPALRDGEPFSMPIPIPIPPSADRSELDAVAVEPRATPRVIPDVAHTRMSDTIPRDLDEARQMYGTFTFSCENIHANGPVDFGIASAPPVGKRLEIEFYTSPQRTGAASADPPILIHRLPIGPDGKVEAELPAGVPLFEVLRRPDESLPVGRDGQIFHVGGFNFGEAGQKARCVGCHAGHSMMEIATDPTWTNLAPSAVIRDDQRHGPNFPRNDIMFNFTVESLVDRRTDPFVSEWAPIGPAAQYNVKLVWSVPIRAREIVVYAARNFGAEKPGQRDQTISAFTLSTALGEVPPVPSRINEALRQEGTRVAWNDVLEFDTLTLTIDAADVRGTFEGQPVPGLAEIEVIARAASGSEPMVTIVRGDADCNGAVQLSDSVVTLAHLFLGQGSLCCGTSADANADGQLNMTDPIVTLRHLFMGGAPLPPPFPRCGRVPEGGFVCDQETPGNQPVSCF